MIRSKQIVVILSILMAVLLTVSCGGDGQVRKYKEKGTAPAKTQTSPHAGNPVPTPPADATHSAAKPHFHWDAPEGWVQAKNTSNFRLATFTVKSEKAEASCTIVPLSGAAGGLKANVSRWHGQITGQGGHMDPKLQEGDAAVVEKLLSAQEKFLTKGQFPAALVDFTAVTPKDDAPSILATLVTVKGSTVFIKMTGPKALLVANKAKFKALCKSFSSHSGSHGPSTETQKSH